MKTTLEVIGAAVLTIVILGAPVLSFVSFVYDWNDFLKMNLIIFSAVDFLFVLDKLIGETEWQKN